MNEYFPESLTPCLICGDLPEDCSCSYQVPKELCTIGNCADPQQATREHEYTERSVPGILETFHEHFGFIDLKERFPATIKRHLRPCERERHKQKIRKAAYERKKARKSTPSKNLTD